MCEKWGQGADIFHVGIIRNCQCLCAVPLAAQFPQESSHFQLRGVSQAVRVLNQLNREGAICLLLALPFTGSPSPFLLSAKLLSLIIFQLLKSQNHITLIILNVFVYSLFTPLLLTWSSFGSSPSVGYWYECSYSL